MKQFTSARCPECQSEFDGCPVERDEDGAYAVLEVKPCSGCDKLLCPDCAQFHCDGCGDTFCADHLVSVPDGETPLHCCQACAAECVQDELELVSCCPECRSPNVLLMPYDFGADAQTGYQDAGEGFRCLDCFAKGDSADLATVPPRRPVVSETATPAAAVQTA
jgi:hypothetical protein